LARPDILINEIHYDPTNNTELLEFVELYNADTTTVDMAGWYFSAGFDYTFPSNTLLAPGEYLVVAENTNTLFAHFGTHAFGPFQGRLDSAGETVRLRDANGDEIDEVDYSVGFPWPTASAGEGSSMELVHPSLDNDLGASWRPSAHDATSISYIPMASSQWHYREGTSEASSPSNAWRQIVFEEDASWNTGQTPIGYENGSGYTLNTTLTNMFNQFTSVYLRHAIIVPSLASLPQSATLRVYVDDGCIVWLNGTELNRFHVAAGEIPHNGVAVNHEATWETLTITNAASLFVEGTNIVAVHALNTRVGSSDFVFDLELTASRDGGAPTPGRVNSMWALNVAPQMRQVNHTPRQPATNEAIVVTAKITDTNGVANVTLDYQVVLPGSFIPALLPLDHATLLSTPYAPAPTNAAYWDPANWQQTNMVDNGVWPDEVAGDDIYSVLLPPQPMNRTLVRYRITATDGIGLGHTAPFDDDPQLNFACFVYSGVPPYTAATRSVHPDGAGHTYDTNVMHRLPVYHMVTRAADYEECYAYNSADRIPSSNDGARRRFNWPGAFVYEGKVYDHVFYRLRQHNDRYGLAGKRSFRVRFNKGRYLEARDNYGKRYPTRWKTLNVGKLFDNKDIFNFGMTENMNFHLWNLVGTPAPFSHLFHYRVVKGVEEAPSGANGQYYGDFQGMNLAIENYDARFLDAHDLSDGNVYKLKNGQFDPERLQRHQGRYSVGDGSDFNYVRSDYYPDRTDQWIEEHIDLYHWYRCHTVCRAIRHQDFKIANSHLKNRAWYFGLDGSTNIYGRLTVLPHDADASWGPNWGNGAEDYPKYCVFGSYGKPIFKRQYRNYMREFIDLLWTEEVINTWIDDHAGIVGEFAMAERDRWISAPADAGTHSASKYWSFAEKIQDMKNFAFYGWSGSTGPDIPAGGQRAVLLDLANEEGHGDQIPNTPTVTYVGDTNYPINGLVFQCSAFSDPQGDDSFGALQWRVGDVTDMVSPTFDPVTTRRQWEYSPVWESGDITTYTNQVKIPAQHLEVGRTYRVRVRMLDNTTGTGYASHWSAPVEFTTSDSDNRYELISHLRVTEVMYNPPAGSDYEFIELHNASTNLPLHLAGAAFASGIDYVFTNGTVLLPGGYLVLTRHPSEATFRAHYGLDGSAAITGPYSGKLANGGEELRLETASGGLAIFNFSYGDGRGWPATADGGGHALVPVDLAVTEQGLDYGGNWRASTLIGGSPGSPDPAPPATLVINEITAHTDTLQAPPLDSDDWVEILNVSSGTISLAEWYLSDDIDLLTNYALPTNRVLNAGERITLTERLHFNPDGVSGFGLNKAGESVFLSYLDGTTNARIADAVVFKGQENDTSLGRYPDGTIDWYALTPTPDATNTAPAEHVVIGKVMYHPQPTATHPEDNTNDEFIEIYNPTDAAVDLWNAEGPWRLDGVGYTFPSNTVIPAGGYLVVVSFDPATNTSARAAFLDAYGLEEGDLTLLGPLGGKLSNRGERIALERPQAPDVIGDSISWVIVDEVIYFDRSPWPEGADGEGAALRRVWPDRYGRNPNYWLPVSGGSPGSSPDAVSIKRPLDGSFFMTPIAELFEAEVDPGTVTNAIQHVEFYANDTLLHRDETAPYYAYLDTMTHEGIYDLRIELTDALGQGYTSRQHRITVYGPPPVKEVNRMQIAFDGYNRPTPLENFPALVRLHEGLDGFSYADFADEDGRDLRFADSTERSSLVYEIDEWNTNGVSTVWVRIPELTPETFIWAYWGSTNLTNVPVYVTDGSTWSEGFTGVWHFGDDFTDSVAGLVATNHGTSTDAAGAIGSARHCNGVDAYIAPGLGTGDYVSATAPLTVTLWAKPQKASTVFGSEDASGGSRLLIAGRTIGNYLWRYGVNSTEVGAATMAATGTWHHLALTVDGTQPRGALNGGNLVSVGSPTAYSLAAAPTLGCLNANGVPGDFFEGTVDEFRVAHAPRSEDWLWAEYATVMEAETFAAYSMPPRYDIDDDNDNMPDAWEMRHFKGTDVPLGGELDDWDGDGLLNGGEYIAGTDPTNALDFFSLDVASSNGRPRIGFTMRTTGDEHPGMARYYRLKSRTSMERDAQWVDVPGFVKVPAEDSIIWNINTDDPKAVYRGGVWLDPTP